MISFYVTYWLLGIIVLPGLLLGIYAQARVHSAYREMSQIKTKKGVTANQIAREVLDTNQLDNIVLTTTDDTLGDNYNPENETIALSPGVNNQSTISSVGIALHEVGHAIQDKEGYAFAKVRRFLVPVINLCSTALWPLIIIGVIFNFGGSSDSIIGDIFMWAGVIFFGLSIIFSLITLPTEIDASRRAMRVLKDGDYLDSEELQGVKKVLGAAAWTYVAALLVAILNFARFLLTILILRRD